MSQLKKVLFKLTLVDAEKNKSVFSNLLFKYKLKKGYDEMALINLSLAEMCFDADNEALRQCEEKLTECE